METNITFEQLPNEVAKLREDVHKLMVLMRQNQAPKPIIDEDLPVGIKEASKILKLAVPTIYSKVSKGELPYYKNGKFLLFNKNELMEYIKQGRRKTDAEIEAEADAYLYNKKKGRSNGNH